MQHEFGKCDHCGTWHQIEVIYWGGIEIKSCPYILKDVMFPVRDPDEDNPISASYQRSA